MSSTIMTPLPRPPSGAAGLPVTQTVEGKKLSRSQVVGANGRVYGQCSGTGISGSSSKGTLQSIKSIRGFLACAGERAMLLERSILGNEAIPDVEPVSQPENVLQQIAHPQHQSQSLHHRGSNPQSIDVPDPATENRFTALEMTSNHILQIVNCLSETLEKVRSEQNAIRSDLSRLESASMKSDKLRHPSSTESFESAESATNATSIVNRDKEKSVATSDHGHAADNKPKSVLINRPAESSAMRLEKNSVSKEANLQGVEVFSMCASDHMPSEPSQTKGKGNSTGPSGGAAGGGGAAAKKAFSKKNLKKSQTQELSEMMAKSSSASASGWLEKKLQMKDAIGSSESLNAERPSKLQDLVRSPRFTFATALLICVNAVEIGLETDYGDGSTMWQVIELTFLACYTLELILRVGGEGFKIFRTDGWIRFDAVVLMIAFTDMCIITPLLQGTGGEAKQVAMVMRITRLMKLTRIIRLLRFFKELWLLVSSFGSAFKTLGWTLVLLIMVIYVFGILFVKLVGDMNDDEEIQMWFGDLGGAMFTLFQIMTLEGWDQICRKLWATEQGYMVTLVFIFIGTTSFAIMNTVMAVIVEHVLGEAMSQKDEAIKKAEQEMNMIANQLLDLFAEADTDGGGTLSKDEFINALAANETRALLTKMDLGEDFAFLEREDVATLFEIMDIDRNLELTPQEFVNGIMQMRGGARARRIFEMHCEIRKFRNQTFRVLTGLKNDVNSILGKELVSEPLSPSSSATPARRRLDHTAFSSRSTSDERISNR